MSEQTRPCPSCGAAEGRRGIQYGKPGELHQTYGSIPAVIWTCGCCYRVDHVPVSRWGDRRISCSGT